ncbi:hypothetical protein GF324_11015 [bacterium]|nr:hypothetical protein [bacterium]
MKAMPSYFGVFRRTNRSSARGTNGGVCVECGHTFNWRSVNNRCYTCEKQSSEARRPMFVERDILMSAGKAYGD